MELSTAIKGRVIVAFFVILVLISVYIPYVGLPLAILWLGIVIWQYKRQQEQSN
ncbi:MAG: hypothetical protein HND51_14550 [Chloroflexi bacterium]|nr:hypothetical protein [Chloroflexota bacterium]